MRNAQAGEKARMSKTFVFAGALFALLPLRADALAFVGEIERGVIHLGDGWAEEEAFTQLLKVRRAVGGHFLDAPAWWNGHFTADYYYQGNEADVQAVIDALAALKHPHVKVMLIPGEEGFWDNEFSFPWPQTLAYDWSLTFSQTKMNDPAKYKHDGKFIINEPVVVLRVYLGDRLNPQKLRVPERLQSNPQIPTAVRVVGRDNPADALHAIARAQRAER